MSGVIIAVLKGPNFNLAQRRDEIELLLEDKLAINVIGGGYDLVTEELSVEVKVDGDNEDEIAENLSNFVTRHLGLTLSDISFFED